jgi:hypothetical protein
MQRDLIEPGYFDLQALAAYSSCSVRWLRDRLVDRLRPLPHYRIEGKILVKREDFDRWLAGSHVVNSVEGLSEIVDSVVARMRPSKRSA